MRFITLLLIAAVCLASNANPIEEQVRSIFEPKLDIQERIINGEDADKHSHPYIASLQKNPQICIRRMADVVESFLCYDEFSMDWDDKGDCRGAQDNVIYYVKNRCFNARQLFMVNWNYNKSPICAWNNTNTQAVAYHYVQPCYDYSTLSMRDNVYCQKMRPIVKAHWDMCIEPAEFDAKKVSDKKEWKHSCGASLIKDQWILTAAHCVSHMQPGNLEFYRAVLGEHSLETEDAAEDIQEIDEVYMYGGYNEQTIQHDIAILKLKNKVKLSDKVQTVEMSDNDEAYVNDHCILAGWGRSNAGDYRDPAVWKQQDILQEVHIENIPLEECQEWIDNHKDMNGLKVTGNNICVHSRSNETSGAAACHGDSGGPMMCGEDLDKLAGVTSFGHPFCQDTPSVYTRVSAYKQWIENITSDDKDISKKQQRRDKKCREKMEETGVWMCDPREP